MRPTTLLPIAVLLIAGGGGCATLNRGGLGPVYIDAPAFHTGRALGADTTAACGARAPEGSR